MRTEEQNKNLIKLAKYLVALPEDYGYFDMSNFSKYNGEGLMPGECGTVGCAAGHGPAAGIPKSKGQDWTDYCSMNFILIENTRSLEFDWLFGSNWTVLDNTPLGAALRIAKFLEDGLTQEIENILEELSELELRDYEANESGEGHEDLAKDTQDLIDRYLDYLSDTDLAKDTQDLIDRYLDYLSDTDLSTLNED